MRIARWFPLCFAPLLASCIFLLDYDALQRERGGEGGAAGQPGSETGGDEAAGAGPTCGDCNDRDPCTIDTCLAPAGEEPRCQHQASEGLKLDGFQAVLSAEQHVRVSLVGSGRLFYLSALALDQGAPQVSLYRLASDGDELEPLVTDLRFEGNAVSNVGLAVEELAAGQVALHGFVATKLKLAGAVARVVHVVTRDGKATSNVVGLSYREDNPTLFPQALSIGGKIVGAWIQADGSIAVHDVGTAKTENFGDPSLPATSLSLLSTKEDLPAVMFTAQAEAAQPLGAYVQLAAEAPVRLAECEGRPGTYLSSSVIATQVPGLWLANITRVGDDYLTTEGGTLACNDASCVAVAEDCKKHPSPNATRNLAGATVHFDTDEAGVVYSVLALPQITAKADGSNAVEAKLSLALGRTTFNTEPVASETIGGDPQTGAIVVARNDTSEARGFAGPDWPAVAILPGQRVAVAWIGPKQAGAGTELHVERYKMCLGEP